MRTIARTNALVLFGLSVLAGCSGGGGATSGPAVTPIVPNAAPTGAPLAPSASSVGTAAFSFVIPAPTAAKVPASIGTKDVAGANTIYVSLLSVNAATPAKPVNLTFVVDTAPPSAPCKNTGPYIICTFSATAPVGNDVFAIAAYRGLEPISYDGDVAATISTTPTSAGAVLGDVLKNIDPITFAAKSSSQLDIFAALDGPAGPPAPSTNGWFLNNVTFSDFDATGFTDANLFIQSVDGSVTELPSRPPQTPTVTVPRQPVISLDTNVPVGKSVDISLVMDLSPYTIPASQFPQAPAGTIFTQPATEQIRKLDLTCTHAGCTLQQNGTVSFPIS